MKKFSYAKAAKILDDLENELKCGGVLPIDSNDIYYLRNVIMDYYENCYDKEWENNESKGD